jgi:hypothetical protein
MQTPIDVSIEDNPLKGFCFIACALMVFGLMSSPVRAQGVEAGCDGGTAGTVAPTMLRANLTKSDEGAGCDVANAVADHSIAASPRLIVIGFMGGRVKGDNLIHREALVAKELHDLDPGRVYAGSFANHDAQNAFNIVIALLDTDRDGRLSADEKGAARIVIYGHSWGASETVAFARRLNTMNIPVLLTIQVDSVQKPNENDGDIPPNVREAVNFYQTEGMLHGRSLIAAMDPKLTKILGNYESSYRSAPVSCAKFPWFARTFMKAHIEIENDPSVWGKIAALIRTKL